MLLVANGTKKGSKEVRRHQGMRHQGIEALKAERKKCKADGEEAWRESRKHIVSEAIMVARRQVQKEESGTKRS